MREPRIIGSFYRARRGQAIFRKFYNLSGMRGPALHLKSEAVVALHLEPSVTHDGEGCSDIRIAIKDQRSEAKSQCPQMKRGRIICADPLPFLKLVVPKQIATT